MIVEAGQAQAAQDGGPWRNGRSEPRIMKRLLIVELRLGVGVAVVEAGVHVAVVAEVVAQRGADVRRRQVAFSIVEDRALEPIAVDGLLEIDPGVCCTPSRVHDPRVIQSSRLNCTYAYLIRRCSCRSASSGARFAHDVRRDAEGDQVRDVAGDVDVRPAEVERVERERRCRRRP